ncbi:MAG: hypothetical protein QM697_00185 [Lachnospiraceae bacterium]
MENNNFLLAKFGEKENLEALKNGQLYFTPVQIFRNDGTDYRGDKYEGAKSLNPKKISICDDNGKDFFKDLGIPRPDSAMEFIQDDEDTFMFCASIISKEILVKDEKENSYSFTDTYKDKMRNFGDYVLIFQSAEIIDHIKEEKKIFEPKISWEAGAITYREEGVYDDENHTENNSSNIYDRYFFKEEPFKIQNEWRLIVDGVDGPIEKNHNNGLLIPIKELQWAQLYDSDSFLNTFSITE